MIVTKATREAALRYGKNVLKLDIDLYEARYCSKHRGFHLYWVGRR